MSAITPSTLYRRRDLIANAQKVNLVITIDSKPLEGELKNMLKDEQSSLGEQIRVVDVPMAKSLPGRDDLWLLQEREADVKEYFFGDAKMVLSPSTQLVDFDTLTIYKIPESELSRLPAPYPRPTGVC